MVLALGQGLIDAWLFDRAGDRVAGQLDDRDRALAEAVLLVNTIRCDGSSGTGTAFVTRIDDTAVVVTNRHVVEGASTVGVRSLVGRAVPRVTSWRLSQTADVAVLQVDDREPLATPLPLGSDPLPDQPVRTVGFPAALPFTSTGSVEQVDAARATLQLPVAPGASGSPVVDEEGLVVAQIFARTADGLGVATPVSAVIAATGALGGPVSGCEPE